MPWKERSVMDERLRFVAKLLDGESMTNVCRELGISRKTGYKIFTRYKESGFEALSDRSRRPVQYANQLPPQIESLIVTLKREKPHWGARKIRELLVRRLDQDVLAMKTPAEVYTASLRSYRGLPELSYPLHDREVVSPPAGASACTASASTSPPCWPVSASASRRSTKASGSSASCTTISATSTWSRRLCNLWTTRPARGCHLCLRYGPLPMSSDRTRV